MPWVQEEKKSTLDLEEIYKVVLEWRNKHNTASNKTTQACMIISHHTSSHVPNAVTLKGRELLICINATMKQDSEWLIMLRAILKTGSLQKLYNVQVMPIINLTHCFGIMISLFQLYDVFIPCNISSTVMRAHEWAPVRLGEKHWQDSGSLTNQVGLGEALKPQRRWWAQEHSVT